MNILILGSGGREHAFAWKIKQSTQCNQLFIAPGNGGTQSCGTNVDLSVTDFASIREFSINENVEMIIVGPELPLVEGIVDFFENDEQTKGIKIVGPDKNGAQLEGSKAFAKEFMAEFSIPTASYKEFTLQNIDDGRKYIETHEGPYVLKADGLAAGKGVLIIEEKEEAIESLEKMLHGQFGEASSTVVIEEFLKGIEFSVFVLTDGEGYKILPVAKDYKRIGEGDTGLNTGGMGAISPVPFVDKTMMNKVEERIVKPTIEGIKKRGMNYKGFVFIGLINVHNEPYVIEYNCRMGDPETEVVIPRVKNDLISLFDSLFNGTIDETKIDFKQETASTIMLVSGGYPESYEKLKTITGIDELKDVIVFHAGTKIENEQLLTNGGRVIALTAFGENHQEAVNLSRSAAEKIQFERKYYRTDIGFDL